MAYENELLPSFRRTPPPETLREQARQTWAQAGQAFDEYAPEALRHLGTQFTQNLIAQGLTGKTIGQLLMSGAANALNRPAALATIGAIQATRAGAPIVNGVRRFAASPTGQKLKGYTEKILDWGF